MTHDIFMPSAWITPALIQDTGGPIGNPSSSGQPVIPADGSPTGQAAKPQGGMDFMLLILLLFGGMLLITMFSGRRDKKRRNEMLGGLSKKDKVRTAGGVIGSVIEIRTDEVLIETDKASHTRIWFAKGSIASVIKSANAPESSDDASKLSEEYSTEKTQA